jgi:L-cysteine desulfidase
MRGIKSAFIAGLVAGNADAELEVIACVTKEQIEVFNGTGVEIIAFLEKCHNYILGKTNNLDTLIEESNILERRLARIKRDEMQYIRATSASKKVDFVYLTLLQESQNIVAYTINLLKVNKKFQG